jgi:hypothetical protein
VWLADYRATRPKVERKLAPCCAAATAAGVPAYGGWCAGARTSKLLAAAVNLARFASLGLCSTSTGWQLQPA